MSNPWIDIVNLLVEKTKQGTIEWRKAGILTDGFHVTLGDQRIELEYFALLNSFSIAIYRNGVEKDTINDEELHSEGMGDAYKTLQYLYRQASRQVSGADKSLRDVLGTLQAL